MTADTSWGRVARAHHRAYEPAFVDEVPPIFKGGGAPGSTFLGYGLGRSYGDVCLNDGGSLIRTHRLDHVLAVDWDQGIFRAEAGFTLDALLRLCVPHGWFIPVTPGTKFVTLGGAVANDVHGKNHECAGTFGCHIRALGLTRSTGEVLEVGPERNPALFEATVGGLGLTGLILWVELQLVRVTSSDFEIETTQLADLDAFFEVASESRDWPYTVAWIDCFAKGAALGRGLFTRGRHAHGGPLLAHVERKAARIPLDAPPQLLSTSVVRGFNELYIKQPRTKAVHRVHYDGFLYPLDHIEGWNRLYGRRGFFQHQSVVPLDEAPGALRQLLKMASMAGQGSFLVVLKLLGARASPGLLSFPMEGATFALDLPNRGEETRDLLHRMAKTVTEARGRLYPAKDASMSPEVFQAGYPRWRELEARRDPGVMSDFWRRVTRESA